MSSTLQLLMEALPSPSDGFSDWALKGLSIGSLLTLIIGGLATSRLWTKSQVDIIRADHTRAIDNLVKQHDREIEDLKARYELHINRTVELYQGRVDDARDRENQWHVIADRWQSVSEMLGAGIEPMQEQSATTLRILQAWQAESTRKGYDS